MKIFRKIRQQLAAENNVAKYLRYAFGEIVLVVIGILIALQVNTYSKENQNKALARTSIENLREDLNIQKEIIQQQLDNEASMLRKVDSCFLYLHSNLPVGELAELLEQLSSRHTFVANKATFNSMGYNGAIVFLHGQVLQNEIVRYYQQLDYTTAVINNNNLFLIDNQFGNFVVNNSLGFRLTKDGNIDEAYTMGPEQRFTLQRQLSIRSKASLSIVKLCNQQLEATDKLIQQIDYSLKD
jgi:uncharacterized membrane-anchored protein YhcB (DUF1043 family)